MQIAEKHFKKLNYNLSQCSGFIGDASLEPAKNSPDMVSVSPIDNSILYTLKEGSKAHCDQIISASNKAYLEWRNVPAPKRAEVIRIFAEILRENKDHLAKLITLEVGKIPTEAAGEVQEMIDICDLAVGLGRQLYGLTMPSERPGHRLMEQWHPLGPILVISAFNFPTAVWAWNACLALVCGNTMIWKPSEKAPLCSFLTHKLFQTALSRTEYKNLNVCSLILGGKEIGEYLTSHESIPLVSATGSTRMGRAVAETCAKRFAKSLLELGGNNACIVCPSADLEMAVRAIVFSAVGTAGQRCTTMRRLIVHSSIKDELLKRLLRAYSSLKIGNPLDAGTLVGPLIDSDAVQAFVKALGEAKNQGGLVHCGSPIKDNYVSPAIVEIDARSEIVSKETFAPILYLLSYEDIDQAISINNMVRQGLSSSIFSNNLKEIEQFLSQNGSDCGIANVNMGGSGAEIGGAFGGEKETGGGRECGSDSWKAYMRRLTTAINYSDELPLAQGVNFS